MLKKRIDLEKGLSIHQVKERIEKGFVNNQNNTPTRTVSHIVRTNIVTLFNLINLILAIFVALVHSYKNMLFMGVIICNVAVGIFQEIRAKRVIDKLSLLSAPKAKVLRDGEEQEIALQQIVMDDILLLNSGNQICADAILVKGQCEVNESLITGESEPVLKQEGDELLSGSFIISGDVLAQVTKVGKESYVNRILSGAKYIKKPNSEMMQSINWIIKTVTFFIVPIGIILFYKQICMVGQKYDRAVVSTVAAMVGMIPEGLILLSSVVLAVSAIRLARHNTLVQELFCIETLARVDVLCLDKTGTITEGNMKVDEVVLLDGTMEQVSDGLNGMMDILNDANPTFLAVKDRFHEGTDWHTVKRVPFNSANKWSLVEFEESGTYVLGAAEYILGQKAKPYMEQIEKFSRHGQRVLLLAHTRSAMSEKQLPEDLTPYALIVLSDKIRAEAKDTLEYFKRQDVTIKIISGDNPVTVANVAKKAGLEQLSYIDMTEVTSDEELERAVDEYQIFGRVTPQQKLDLVKALKKKGHTVAMTGDGVNDVLALKEADCSIAMQSGSDAARNVSQLVLLDSNFASMPKVVAEGRRSINNLQRSASLFLVKTIYAFVLGLAFVFIKAPYPFSPIQLTLISSITIGMPSFVLALEPNLKRVEGKFLPNVLKKALPGGLLTVTNVLLLVALERLVHGSVEQNATMATITTAFAHMIVLYHICKPFNLVRRILCSLVVIGFVGAITIFHKLFIIVPLTTPMVLLVIGLCVLSLTLHPIYTYLVDRVLKR